MRRPRTRRRHRPIVAPQLREAARRVAQIEDLVRRGAARLRTLDVTRGGITAIIDTTAAGPARPIVCPIDSPFLVTHVTRLAALLAG